MNVAKALIVAWRATELVVRSICASRATLTAAPTIPQTEARRACSRLNAARKSLHVITEKAGEPSSYEFFSSRADKPTRAQTVRCEDTGLEVWHELISRVLQCHVDLRHSAEKGNDFSHHAGSIRGDIEQHVGNTIVAPRNSDTFLANHRKYFASQRGGHIAS